MATSLSALADALAHERTAFLEALAALGPARRTAPPAPGAWSALEIGEHAFRAERATLRGVEKQLAVGDERRDVGSRSAARVKGLLMALQSPKKFRVPAGARGVHPEGMTYEALRAAWEALPLRWTQVVDTVPPPLLETPLIRHPLGGPMTVEDALRFLTVHTARHLRQVQRIASAAPVS